MARLHPSFIRRLLAVVEVRRIGDDEIIPFLRFVFLDGCRENFNFLWPGRMRYIFNRLISILWFDLDTVDNDVCGCALCQHQGDNTRTGSDIENAAGVRRIYPCAQQHAVGSYLHGRAVVTDRELFEMEMCTTFR